MKGTGDETRDRIWKFMFRKSSRSQLFLKIGALKNSQNPQENVGVSF